MLLKHFGMWVEARIANIRDFTSKKFDSIGRVAKYDGLVNLQLENQAASEFNTDSQYRN
jgi:hypothetical protein